MIGSRVLNYFWSHPGRAMALIFILDFCALVIIRDLEDGRLFIPFDNKTFTYGDGVFLPIYAGMMSLALRDKFLDKNGIYLKWWWHLGLVGLGICLTLGIEVTTVQQGHLWMFDQHPASKIYHRIIFVPMFYLIASVLPLVKSFPKPVWSLGIAMVSLSMYLMVAYLEMHPLAEQTVLDVYHLGALNPL